MHGAPVRTSTPGMDAWRPSGDRLTYSDAWWSGAAPIARWLALLLSQGVFWALVFLGVLAAWHEAVALVRHRRTHGVAGAGRTHAA